MYWEYIPCEVESDAFFDSGEASVHGQQFKFGLPLFVLSYLTDNEVWEI